MKFKSVLALLLLFLMCLPFAAGCSRKGEESSDNTTMTIDHQDIHFGVNDEFTNSAETCETTQSNGLLPFDTASSEDAVLNVLFLGIDRYGDMGLSDAVMLLSIDNNHKKIKLTSFMRDTYVDIPGYYPHKLNLAYSLGGLYEYDAAGLSVKTIEENYGIRIDRYVIANFSTFMEIVDILGGVELYVTEEEIGYINAQIAENAQSDFLYASEGNVKLSGLQALWYVRNRGGFGFGGDDWDRTERQRKFIEAVITSVKDASLSEITRIINSIVPNVLTDFSGEDISILLPNALTFLNYDVEGYCVPHGNNWKYDWDDVTGSIICVEDWELEREKLKEFIYEDEAE